MAESRGRPRAGGRVDLRHTDTSLGSVVGGYGLTPSSARKRAAVVRAVTRDTDIRQRPMPVVLVTGLMALAALAVWGWQLYLAVTEDVPLSALFWVGLATFLVTAAICSWAWQLYDAQKAVVMWLAIVLLGLAAALIIVFLLVALKGDGDLDIDLDLDGLLDKITGSEAAGDPVGFADRVVLPVAADMAEMMEAPGGPGELGGETPADAEPYPGPTGPLACAACGGPLVPGFRACPRCGRAA